MNLPHHITINKAHNTKPQPPPRTNSPTTNRNTPNRHDNRMKHPIQAPTNNEQRNAAHKAESGIESRTQEQKQK